MRLISNYACPMRHACAMLVASAALWFPGITVAEEWSAGGGLTYQFDPTSSAYVVFGAWTPQADRYEFAAFRFLTSQKRAGELVAAPNWVFEASKRWRWTVSPRIHAFAGFGAAFKTKTDDVNGSRLNFAESLGCRFVLSAHLPVIEVALRHISNAGLKRPNRGEDFATIALVF